MNLRGEKILLRFFKISDAEFIFNNITNPDVRFQLRSLPDPYNIEHAYEFLAKVERDFTSGTAIHLGIEKTESSELAGVIGAILPEAGSDEAEIGYWIAKQDWGRGYASAAIKLMLNFLKYERGICNVKALVFENNFASVKVLEKNGFVNKGLSEQQYCNSLNDAKIILFKKSLDSKS